MKMLTWMLLAIGSGLSVAQDKPLDQSVEPLLTSNGKPFVPKACYPEFSWDRVPVYMMFADGSRLLKDSEVEKIASETDFICIEKNHGLEPLGDAVLGLEHENQAFKQVKPGIKRCLAI